MAKNLCTTAIALSALVKFEPWYYIPFLFMIFLISKID
jgi:hypothetical protein